MAIIIKPPKPGSNDPAPQVIVDGVRVPQTHVFKGRSGGGSVQTVKTRPFFFQAKREEETETPLSVKKTPKKAQETPQQQTLILQAAQQEVKASPKFEALRASRLAELKKELKEEEEVTATLGRGNITLTGKVRPAKETKFITSADKKKLDKPIKRGASVEIIKAGIAENKAIEQNLKNIEQQEKEFKEKFFTSRVELVSTIPGATAQRVEVEERKRHILDPFDLAFKKEQKKIEQAKEEHLKKFYPLDLTDAKTEERVKLDTELNLKEAAGLMGSIPKKTKPSQVLIANIFGKKTSIEKATELEGKFQARKAAFAGTTQTQKQKDEAIVFGQLSDTAGKSLLKGTLAEYGEIAATVGIITVAGAILPAVSKIPILKFATTKTGGRLLFTTYAAGESINVGVGVFETLTGKPDRGTSRISGTLDRAVGFTGAGLMAKAKAKAASVNIITDRATLTATKQTKGGTISKSFGEARVKIGKREYKVFYGGSEKSIKIGKKELLGGQYKFTTRGRDTTQIFSGTRIVKGDKSASVIDSISKSSTDFQRSISKTASKNVMFGEKRGSVSFSTTETSKTIRANKDLLLKEIYKRTGKLKPGPVEATAAEDIKKIDGISFSKSLSRQRGTKEYKDIIKELSKEVKDSPSIGPDFGGGTAKATLAAPSTGPANVQIKQQITKAAKTVFTTEIAQERKAASGILSLTKTVPPKETKKAVIFNTVKVERTKTAPPKEGIVSISLTPQKQEQEQKQKTEAKVSIGSSTRFGTLNIPRASTKTGQAQKQGQKTKQDTAQKTIQDTAQITIQDTAQKTIQDTAQRVDITTGINIQHIFKPTKGPPPIPNFNLKFGGSDNLGGLFTAEVRREGKFKSIGLFESEAQAFKRAKLVISTTAAASGRVRKPGGDFSRVNLFPTSQFRLSKTEASVFVEKREKRIKSKGELFEITFKGIQAQRNKKSRSIFAGV